MIWGRGFFIHQDGRKVCVSHHHGPRWLRHDNRRPQWKWEYRLVLNIKEKRKERGRWRSLVYLPAMWVSVLVLDLVSCKINPPGGGGEGMRQIMDWSRHQRTGRGRILTESSCVDSPRWCTAARSVAPCTAIVAAPFSPPPWIKRLPLSFIRCSHPLRKKGSRLSID